MASKLGYFKILYRDQHWLDGKSFVNMNQNSFIKWHAGPLLPCNSSLVFEMETGNIVCEMNTSITIDNITVMTAGQTLMTVYPNGTNNYFSDEFDKYQSTIGTIFTFGIKNVSCRDKDEYTFTVNVGDGGRCSKTASLDIKGSRHLITCLCLPYRRSESDLSFETLNNHIISRGLNIFFLSFFSCSIHFRRKCFWCNTFPEKIYCTVWNDQKWMENS